MQRRVTMSVEKGDHMGMREGEGGGKRRVEGRGWRTEEGVREEEGGRMEG